MQGMHISIILSWINKIYPTQQKISSKELSFYNIRIWEHDEQEIMKDYLYLAADTSSLECDWTPQKPPLLICCVKKAMKFLWSIPPGTNMLFFFIPKTPF